MTEEQGIKARLLEIRETEARAVSIQEEAESAKLQLVEDARKQAKQIVEAAGRELDKYRAFVDQKTRQEAGVTEEALAAKGDEEIETLLEKAQRNRSRAVDEVLKQLTGPGEGN